MLLFLSDNIATKEIKSLVFFGSVRDIFFIFCPRAERQDSIRIVVFNGSLIDIASRMRMTSHKLIQTSCQLSGKIEKKFQGDFDRLDFIGLRLNAMQPVGEQRNFVRVWAVGKDNLDCLMKFGIDQYGTDKVTGHFVGHAFRDINNNK